MAAAPETHSGAPATPLAVMTSLDLSEFREIAAIMQQETCIHLPESKITLVRSRLSRRLRGHRLTHFRDYVALVRRDTVERAAMVDALTTNHTHFFREVHHFDHLREQVLPELQARARQGEPVRIWSAGCSSGEEVYSIAMTLAGMDAGSVTWLGQGSVRLLATDIASHVVQAVRQAQYPALAAARIPSPYLTRWMEQENDSFTVAETLRGLVTARVLNLFGPWPMQRQFDAIFCRNVMIYFDDAAKVELETRLIDQLTPGGHLYIGHSERLAGSTMQKVRPVGQTVYRKVDI